MTSSKYHSIDISDSFPVVYYVRGYTDEHREMYLSLVPMGTVLHGFNDAINYKCKPL